jgi:hypothetical protein
MFRRHSKLYIIEPCATFLRDVANITKLWKRQYNQESREPMTYMKQTHHAQEVPDNDIVQKSNRPYWKRMHHDWRFWVALLLTLAAMIIYVVIEDFAWLPRGRSQRPHQTPAENSAAP